jgi:hypothetical protein
MGEVVRGRGREDHYNWQTNFFSRYAVTRARENSNSELKVFTRYPPDPQNLKHWAWPCNLWILLFNKTVHDNADLQERLGIEQSWRTRYP